MERKLADQANKLEAQTKAQIAKERQTASKKEADLKAEMEKKLAD